MSTTVHIKGEGQVKLSKSNFVAAGGEGSVYAVGNRAFKVYKDPKKMIPEGKIQELAGITDPTVIKPEKVLLDSRGKPIGYTMRFVQDTYALCQLFPRAFRDREGLTPQGVVDLVLRMRQQIENIHRAGVLVVDLNEMNFLVSRDFSEVYAIDVDSYQTAHYPATAIMPSVRDWHTPIGDFNENSDWFSFACVSFQMFIGMHPYKGKHPSIKGMENRMKANVSAFNSDVRLPKVCFPLDVIPDSYRQWMQAVLEDGKRLPPPTDLVATLVVVPKVKTLSGTANLDIKEILVFGDAFTPVMGLGYSGGAAATLTNDSVWINGNRVLLPQKVTKAALAFTPKMNKVVVASLENGEVTLFNATDRQVLPFTMKGSQIAAHDGRIYVHNKDKVFEIVLHDTVTKVLPSARPAVNVLPHASQLYSGCVVQDLLGATYVSVFPKSGRAHQVHMEELDQYRVVSARFDGGVLMVEGIYQHSVAIGAKGGASRYDRLIFRFDEDYKSYDVRVEDDVQPSGCNFVTLDTGIAVHLNDEEKLELFKATKGHTAVKIIDDAVLGGDMLLTKQGGTLVFTRGGKLYSMRMK